ncbi:MAG: YqgE/AlgH family protein [Planctomycetota bacterium]
MDLQLPAGSLLAAWPGLPDPNFAESVLLICEHGEGGAYGLVVNRALDLTVADLLPDHPVLGQLSAGVHLGGPVEQQRLQFLHMLPGRIRGGAEVCTGLWIGGELEDVARVLAEAERGQASRPPVRLFLGYAGWAGGQLEGELAGSSWMPAPFDASVVFEGEGDAWRRVVESVDPDRPRGVEDELGGASAN